MDKKDLDNVFREISELKDMSRETQCCIQALDKKVDLHIQKTEYELRAIRDLDVQQNGILEEHHKRSDRLALDNKLREDSLRIEFNDSMSAVSARLDVVEAPRKWLRSNWNLILIGGAGAEAFHQIIQFLQTLKTLSPK